MSMSLISRKFQPPKLFLETCNQSEALFSATGQTCNSLRVLIPPPSRSKMMILVILVIKSTANSLLCNFAQFSFLGKRPAGCQEYSIDACSQQWRARGVLTWFDESRLDRVVLFISEAAGVTFFTGSEAAEIPAWVNWIWISSVHSLAGRPWLPPVL